MCLKFIYNLLVFQQNSPFESALLKNKNKNIRKKKVQRLFIIRTFFETAQKQTKQSKNSSSSNLISINKTIKIRKKKMPPAADAAFVDGIFETEL